MNVEAMNRIVSLRTYFSLDMRRIALAGHSSAFVQSIDNGSLWKVIMSDKTLRNDQQTFAISFFIVCSSFDRRSAARSFFKLLNRLNYQLTRRPDVLLNFLTHRAVNYTFTIDSLFLHCYLLRLYMAILKQKWILLKSLCTRFCRCLPFHLLQ